MKAFAIVPILAISVCASAQTASSPTEPGISLLRVQLQRTTSKSPQMRAVPSTDPSSQARARADQQRDVDSNPALHRLSRDAEIAPISGGSAPFGNQSSSDPTFFIASILVKNIGTKTINAVNWEYLMFETGGKEPVKRYRVHSKRIILPDEQAELTKEVQPKGKEQEALIARVEYADGTVWELAKNSTNRRR